MKLTYRMESPDEVAFKFRQRVSLPRLSALSVKIRATQIKSALRTLQLAPALAQLCRTIWAVLARICSDLRSSTVLIRRNTPRLAGFARHRGSCRRLRIHGVQPNKRDRGTASIKRSSLYLFIYAARSLTTAAVRLQQSPTISHAPNRRHTRTYFPRSGVIVPSDWCTSTENRPSSIAMSPE